MDKTQTPPGRDGGDEDAGKKQIHLGPKHMMKAKDVAKSAEKELNKAMDNTHKNKARKMYELADRLSKVDTSKLNEQELSERDAMIQRLAQEAKAMKQGVTEARGFTDQDLEYYDRLAREAIELCRQWQKKPLDTMIGGKAMIRITQLLGPRGLLPEFFKVDITAVAGDTNHYKDQYAKAISGYNPAYKPTQLMQRVKELNELFVISKDPNEVAKLDAQRLSMEIFTFAGIIQDFVIRQLNQMGMHNRNTSLRFGPNTQREGVAEANLEEDSDPRATLQQAHNIEKAIDNAVTTATGMRDTVGIAELGNGLVRIYIQRNVGDRRQIPAVKSVIDKIYTEFRSKGWIASQPQGKLPDIGQQVKPNPEQSSEFYGITIGIPVTQESVDEAEEDLHTSFNVVKLGGALNADPRTLRAAIARHMQGSPTRTDVMVLANAFVSMLKNSDDRQIQMIANLIKAGNPTTVPQESTAAIAERNAFVDAMRQVKKGEKFTVGGKEFTKTTSHGEDEPVKENIDTEAYDRLKRVFDFSDFKG